MNVNKILFDTICAILILNCSVGGDENDKHNSFNLPLSQKKFNQTKHAILDEKLLLNATQFTEGGGSVAKTAKSDVVSKSPPATSATTGNKTEVNLELEPLLDIVTGSAKKPIKARKGAGNETGILIHDRPVPKNNRTTTNTTGHKDELAKNITKIKPMVKPSVMKPTVTYSSDNDDYEENLHKIGTPVHALPQSTSNARPDMIIPVVITVFALPLFGVLGYYALKHGREAWKNRHYRRMDFLLDGMYND